jgi:sarcosine oxidase subunit beta
MSNGAQPAGFATAVDADWELVHLEAAVARLPLLQPAGVSARVAGLYEVTPDAHPLLGPTSVEGFHVLAGFSGHGFMHAPGCGLLMAELLLDGKASTLDVACLAPDRFARGRRLEERGVV